MNQQVLVTGGSGFIAGHCIIALLNEGYQVRATLRSLDKEQQVRQNLQHAGLTDETALTFVAADLMSDDGWADAAAGCESILHVASPVHPGAVKDENDLIIPAREGAVRVLRAAREAGVRRVVLTSAFHAVAWGHPHDDRIFTEADWTNIDGPGVDAYGKSKTLAERAAWDFVTDGGPELATILPVAVMGPMIGPDISGANNVIRRLLTGAVPAFLNLYFPIVDVRDVAAAHVAAMATPEAAGQRFLLSSGPALPMQEIGEILRDALGDKAARVPNQSVPDDLIRQQAESSPELQAMVPDLGYARRPSNDRAREVLRWEPRPAREAIVSAAQSMVDAGLVTG